MSERVRVRIGVHSGLAFPHGGEYFALVGTILLVWLRSPSVAR